MLDVSPIMSFAKEVRRAGGPGLFNVREKKRAIATVDDVSIDELPDLLVQSHLGGFVNRSSIDEENHTVEAMISTNILDRWGEIMEPSGWKLKNFKKNPIVLYNHHDDGLPIGRALDVAIVENGLWSKIEFAVGDGGAIDEIWRLVTKKVLKAWSVGWWPIKWETIDGKEKGEGPVWSRNGIRFVEQELWEASQVTIPAGSNALTLGISRCAIETADLFGIELPRTALDGDGGTLSQGLSILESCPTLREEIMRAAGNRWLPEAGAGEVSKKIATSVKRNVAPALPANDAREARTEIEGALAELVFATSEIKSLR